MTLRDAAQEIADLTHDYDLNEHGQAAMASLRAALAQAGDDLTAAWDEALRFLPAEWDLSVEMVDAGDTGFVARGSNPRTGQGIAAWSRPKTEPNASPARALHHLAYRFEMGRSLGCGSDCVNYGLHTEPHR